MPKFLITVSFEVEAESEDAAQARICKGLPFPDDSQPEGANITHWEVTQIAKETAEGFTVVW